MGYLYKYFIFNFKNWSMIDYTGFRDLSYAVQMRIVEVIG